MLDMSDEISVSATSSVSPRHRYPQADREPGLRGVPRAASSCCQGLGVAVLVVLIWACPQTPVPPLGSEALEPASFTESYRDEAVPVSGGLRKGVLAGPVTALVVPGLLTTWLPAQRTGRLCVTIESIDGRYYGELEYELQALPQGHRILWFPTAFEARLREYRARELAVLSYFAPTCDDPIDLILPVAWGDEELPGGETTLFINSQDMDTQLYLPDADRYIDCDSSPSSRPQLAYDSECSITVAGRRKTNDLVLVRQHFGDRPPPVAVPVYIP